MVPHVLGVGYAYNEYEVTAGRWKEFEIEFDYADNIKQAAAMLSFKEYICVAICSDVIPQDDLDILRQKCAVPIIVVPPSYSEEQRYASLNAPRAGNIKRWFQNISTKQPSIDELKTVLIKDNFPGNFEDAKLTLKFGKVRRRISLSEFTGVIAEYDITDKLELYADGSVKQDSLYKLVDEYALHFLE